MLTVSLIIPVYNEERHIKACLDSISKQSVAPDSVIVVDNNCSDATIEIAEKYPFVQVIKEQNQGRAYARSAGFNLANTDIIGRIDADSRLDDDWVEKVKRYFETDVELQGVTGLARTAVLPYINVPKAKIFSRAYFWFAHAGFRTVTMWGANMAIRHGAWQQVKDEVCLDDKQVHEDQDLSLEMAAKGMKQAVKNDLLITTNGQTYRYLPKLIHYASLYEKTRRLHRKKGTLDSTLLPRLGFWETLPGRICALPLAIYLLLISVVPFPLDYFIVRSKYRHVITK